MQLTDRGVHIASFALATAVGMIGPAQAATIFRADEVEIRGHEVPRS